MFLKISHGALIGINTSEAVFDGSKSTPAAAAAFSKDVSNKTTGDLFNARPMDLRIFGELKSGILLRECVADFEATRSAVGVMLTAIIVFPIETLQ